MEKREPPKKKTKGQEEQSRRSDPTPGPSSSTVSKKPAPSQPASKAAVAKNTSTTDARSKNEKIEQKPGRVELPADVPDGASTSNATTSSTPYRNLIRVSPKPKPLKPLISREDFTIPWDELVGVHSRICCYEHPKATCEHCKSLKELLPYLLEGIYPIPKEPLPNMPKAENNPGSFDIEWLRRRLKDGLLKPEPPSVPVDDEPQPEVELADPTPSEEVQPDNRPQEDAQHDAAVVVQDVDSNGLQIVNPVQGADAAYIAGTAIQAQANRAHREQHNARTEEERLRREEEEKNNCCTLL